MKTSKLISLIAAVMPLSAFAVPASPELIKAQNPDGTIVELKAHGDEYFHYAYDVQTSQLMAKESDGYWRPVVIEGKTLTTSAGDLALYKSLQPVDVVKEAHKSNRQRMAAVAADGRTTYNCKGTVASPVILVQFSDVKFNSADANAAYNDLCNKVGYNEYNSCGSAADYYRSVSNGQFNPVFNVYGPVTLPNTQSYYSSPLINEKGQQLTRDKIFELIYDAVTALDATVDFSPYDLDNNGTVDNVFFYYAGNGQADTMNPNFIWPHQGDYFEYASYLGKDRLIVDGIELRTYACGNEIRGNDPTGQGQIWRDGIGTFTHEFAHVLGLPDMYDTDTTNQGLTSNTKTPGKYDIMDQGPYNGYSTCPPAFSAYERWFCKWLEPAEMLDNPGKYELKSLSTSDNPQSSMLQVRRDNRRLWTEFFFFETRQRTGWDTYFPEEGMFIWRVNYDPSLWATNKPNTKGQPHVELISSGLSNLKKEIFAWPNNVNYSIPNDDKTTALIPQNKVSVPFEAWITNISYDAETGNAQFNYNVVTEKPALATKIRVSEINNTSNDITFSWDPVEGATDYLLTVTSTDATGKVRILDSCNERSMGEKTSHTIYGLTPTVWKRDTEAYVRVVSEIPSSEVSNSLKFVPETYDPKDAVESVIGNDENVYGGQGYINAPEDAVIYTLQGIKTGAENLQPGIYIVKTKQHCYKVNVK